MKRHLLIALTLVCLITFGLIGEARKVQVTAVSSLTTIDPDLYKATTTGSGVDLAGYNAATIIVQVGTVATSNAGIHTFDIQESTNNSTFTSVGAAYLVGTEPVIDTTPEADLTYEIGYTGSLRYLRCKSVVTSTATSGVYYGAIVLRGLPTNEPVN